MRCFRMRPVAVAREPAAWGLLVALLLLCGGCGPSDPRGERVAVGGEVTLDGKPLEAGIIEFRDADAAGEVTAFAFVSGGTYEIPASDGPYVGEAKVTIRGKPIEQAQLEIELEEAARARRRPRLEVVPVPPQYADASPLTADVTEKGENRFDFQLTSRP